MTLSLCSVSGVFAYSASVDRASQLLIDTFAPDCHKSELLDLGCGYGAIGLSLKLMYPQLNVTMSDINSRAVSYARQNAERNRLNVNVVCSDLFNDIEGCFDYIVTNPPMCVGKANIIKLISDSYEHITDGGCFIFTAYHNKGGSTLMKLCSDIFGNCETVERSGGIHIYRSIKSTGNIN